jgi:TPP-dependent indolepyruvate ferredoxin oxidoreductase alpha subunit
MPRKLPQRRCWRPRCITRSAARSPSRAPVGVNVASDALANLSSSGVTGGALVIIGEDYGEGSSIMQERSHAFAMKSQMWLLDPRPNLPSIVQSVHQGFELSEASNTPVMLMVRIRSCHVTGSFHGQGQQAPALYRQGRACQSAQRLCPRRAAADVLHAGTRQDQQPLARSTEVHRREQAQRDVRPEGSPRRHRASGRHVQWCDPGAAAPRPRRYPWRYRDPALCPQCHLPAGQ